MIECKENDCDAQFETQRGFSVHHTVKHKEANKIKCHYGCCGKTKKKYPSELSYHYKKEIEKDTTDIELPCCRECQKEGGEYGANWQGGKTEVECPNCGNETEMWPWRNERNKGYFCTECKSDWYENEFVGEKHPRYKKESIKETAYYGENWRKMRRRVRERDENICQSCGKSENELAEKPSVHHIKPVRTFENRENANTMDNMIQLCRVCHGIVEENMSIKKQKEVFL